ncbi:carbonate dehydratase [Coraliomargarita sp. SDUM461003]|uniref:Carbonic anhydrase n=1 Tax=Thalassobacterium maritimum TaxID=3041265 RepID=A0ABU1APC6_9BACT|nr:carbonate dehydratase [Coraliomargarita sp. SDUM461003]MDQ8205956.1 carbonate dehydratase [Coraliomargarita sp. SDUM461003]
MPTLSKLLENNREWAQKTLSEDPEFFDKLSQQQSPEYLWIGCSDSRVPANQITGLMPGEVFVHRNIANVVVHTDLNLLSVLQYAVDVLKVRHVIVCGHYGCGGVKAAMGQQSHGLIDNWLRHIQDVQALYTEELKPLEGEQKSDRMCELNVIAQANNLRRSTVLQDAWARGQEIDIHSWIYSLKDGQIRTLQGAITS